MTIQELATTYREKAEAPEQYTLPVVSDGSANNIAFGRVMAYKDVVSALERHLRGDFPVEKVQEILNNLADGEDQDTQYSHQKREIYQQALADLAL